DEQDETVRKAMIEAQIFLTYRRDLNNVSIQEARLRRLLEKDEAELNRLIAERCKAAKDRRRAENTRWASAIQHMKVAHTVGLPFDPQEIGFEFSTEEIIAHDQQRRLKAQSVAAGTTSGRKGDCSICPKERSDRRTERPLSLTCNC